MAPGERNATNPAARSNSDAPCPGSFDPSVPSEASPLLASMFFSRGVRHGQQGDSAAEIADYTRAIDLPGAPPEQVAKALGNRGWMRYEAREFPAFLADTQAALALNPEPSLQFNLMLAWLALDEADKAGAVVRATLVNNCPKTAKDRERPRKGRSARGDEDMASA